MAPWLTLSYHDEGEGNGLREYALGGKDTENLFNAGGLKTSISV
jgi:hypothetical protein